MPIDETLRVPLIGELGDEIIECRQYWRPWTLHKPAMISFVGLCVGLLVATELASSSCMRHGSCHVFGDSVGKNGGMPTLSTFVYRALPTILGIALGLRWYVTHYDIIRLEAYTQMSARYGAKASSSLFLKYPYEFVVALPFKALLKEHYIVALSSSILFVVGYAIVPLASGMFDGDMGSTSIITSGNLVEFNPTARQVPTNFTFSAYDFAWRDGSLPPFTTKNFSLLPVKQLDEPTVLRPGENWTFLTTLYEADLECAEAHHINYNYSVWPDNKHLVVEIFQNENSNSVVRVCDALGQQRLDEIGLIQDLGCLDVASFIAPWAGLWARVGESSTFMFGWASGSPAHRNLGASDNVRSPTPLSMTAIFCTTKYYTQAVNATVSRLSGRVSAGGVHPIGKRQDIAPLEGLDKLIIGVVPEDRDRPEEVHMSESAMMGIDPLRFGYPPNKIVDLKYDLVERFGRATRPVSPIGIVTTSESNIYMSMTNTLMAFALSDREDSTLKEWQNPKELESSLRKALKLWFAFAVAEETARSSQSSTIMVERKLPHVRITVNQDWVLAARIGLPLVAVLAALLTYLLEGRPCHIDGEPSTMAEALRLLSASPALCAVMRHSEYHPMKTLMAELDKRGFYFRMGPNKEGTLQIRVFRGEGEHAEEVLEGSEDLNVLEAPGTDAQVQKDPELISPDLIAKANLALPPIFILALITTTVLSKRHDGFLMPGDPMSAWSKVCFGIIPTVLGLTAEALLVILGSTQCMMVPYQALVTKKAKYIDSLHSQYKRNPPHLQLLQSFKRGQYTLFILSLTILISNALPVAMGSIFSHTRNLPKIDKTHHPSGGVPRIRQEAFFQLNRKLADPDYAPSWTTDEYYIDSPFKFAPIGVNKTYPTRAFGVDVNCVVLPEKRVTFPCNNTTVRSTNTSIPPACETYQHTDNVMFLNSPCGGPEDYLYTTWNGTSGDTVQSDKRCPDLIFPLWVQNQRYTVDNPYIIPDSTPPQFGGEDKYDFVVLNCSVTNRIANVSATVHNGKVMSVENEVFELVGKNSTSPLARSFANVTAQLATEYGVYGTHAIQDINWLVAQLKQNVAQGNKTHVPSRDVVAEPFADVLKRLFPLLLRLYGEEMFGVKYVTEYVTEYMEYRAHIMMEPFGVAMGLLVLIFCVVVNVYTKHTGRVMGHLPWNLAGMYSQLYASNAKRDTNTAGKGLERVEEVEVSGEYAYGEYPNRLGKHYGVYRVVGEELHLPAVEIVT